MASTGALTADEQVLLAEHLRTIVKSVAEGRISASSSTVAMMQGGIIALTIASGDHHPERAAQLLSDMQLG